MANALLSDPLLSSVPVIRGFKVLTPCVLYEKLGEGGMGAVYRGRHIKLNIDAAVKCLKIGHGGGEHIAVKRFGKEAELAAQVRHGNLIGVYDMDVYNGLHYIVMELIDGESVEERIARLGPMSPQEALTVTLGVARGLSAAHEINVIHRDVKPPNILISRKGEVKLTDLGIAKTEDPQYTKVSETQALIGTPPYMAPEQFEGAEHVVKQTDVYSLGATFFFMLSGRDPIQGTSIPQIMRKVMDGFPDPSKWGMSPPESCVRLIQKATFKNLDARYANVGEFAREIEVVLAGMGGSATLADDRAGSAKTRSSFTPPPDKTVLTEIKQSLSKSANDLAKTQEEANRIAATLDESRRGLPPIALPSTIDPTRGHPSHDSRPPGGKKYAILAAASLALLATGVGYFVWNSEKKTDHKRKPEQIAKGEPSQPQGPGEADQPKPAEVRGALESAKSTVTKQDWAAMMENLVNAAKDSAVDASVFLPVANESLRAFRAKVGNPSAQAQAVPSITEKLTAIAFKGFGVAEIMLLEHVSSHLTASDAEGWSIAVDRMSRIVEHRAWEPSDRAPFALNNALRDLRKRFPAVPDRAAKLPKLEEKLPSLGAAGAGVAKLLRLEHTLVSPDTSKVDWGAVLDTIGDVLNDESLIPVDAAQALCNSTILVFRSAAPTPVDRVRLVPLLSNHFAKLRPVGKEKALPAAALLQAEHALAQPLDASEERWRLIMGCIADATPDDASWSAALHCARLAVKSWRSTVTDVAARVRLLATRQAFFEECANRGVGLASLTVAEALLRSPEVSDSKTWNDALRHLQLARADTTDVTNADLASAADPALRKWWEAKNATTEKSGVPPGWFEVLESVSMDGSLWATMVLIDGTIRIDDDDYAGPADQRAKLKDWCERAISQSKGKDDAVRRATAGIYFYLGKLLIDMMPKDDKLKDAENNPQLLAELQRTRDEALQAAGRHWDRGYELEQLDCAASIAMLAIERKRKNPAIEFPANVLSKLNFAVARESPRAMYARAYGIGTACFPSTRDTEECDLLARAAQLNLKRAQVALEKRCNKQPTAGVNPPAPSTLVPTTPRNDGRTALSPDVVKVVESVEFEPFRVVDAFQPNFDLWWGALTKDSPVSLKRLQAANVLDDSEKGFVRLIDMMRQIPHQSERQRWTFEQWQDLAKPERDRVKAVQRVLRDHGPDLVKAGYLSE